ncbi:MAG: hypothetical protein AB7V43_06780 [Acidimicrobiia bacterium]
MVVGGGGGADHDGTGAAVVTGAVVAGGAVDGGAVTGGVVGSGAGGSVTGEAGPGAPVVSLVDGRPTARVVAVAGRGGATIDAIVVDS